jgi:hypothetical protein
MDLVKWTFFGTLYSLMIPGVMGEIAELGG